MTDTPDMDGGPIEPSGSAARGTASVPDTDPADATTGQLVARLSQEVSELVRGELELAKAEMTGKAKAAGLGAGLFGGAGVVALYGVGVLIAAAVLALSLAVDAWLAALIVAVVLFAIAGGIALAGRSKVQQATPVTPTETVESVKQDVAAVKEARGR